MQRELQAVHLRWYKRAQPKSSCAERSYDRCGRRSCASISKLHQCLYLQGKRSDDAETVSVLALTLSFCMFIQIIFFCRNAKRRRTNAEIQEEKIAAAQKQEEIQLKLQSFDQLNEQINQLQQQAQQQVQFHTIVQKMVNDCRLVTDG